jgi:hypothetical protein
MSHSRVCQPTERNKIFVVATPLRSSCIEILEFIHISEVVANEGIQSVNAPSSPVRKQPEVKFKPAECFKANPQR